LASDAGWHADLYNPVQSWIAAQPKTVRDIADGTRQQGNHLPILERKDASTFKDGDDLANP
jgi:hypothetical protein